MEATASSAYGWALHEFEFANFNDERLVKRAVNISARLLQNPQRSIPSAMGNWSETKATYRFLDNKKIGSDNMLSAHIEQTVNRCNNTGTILVAQDTTTLNLSHKEIEGLGRIGMGDLQGFFTHSGLAMTTQGVPLGLLYQKSYTRKKETQEKDYKKKARQLPMTEKESIKWVEVVGSIKQALPQTPVVVIGDRESDIYDVFKKGADNDIDLLIRTQHNRRITEDGIRLFDRAQTGSIVIHYTANVPIAKHSHKTREAKLTIRVITFSLACDKNRKKENLRPIPVTLLDISEENPPSDKEPIHWMLTTTLSVKTADDAIEKVQWYIYRWRIERFHYILKTGAFNIEKLQFETFQKFQKAITLFSIVAYRVLWAIYESRNNPKQTAELIFSKEEIMALSFIAKRKEYTLTIEEAVKQTAKLGGYLARKGDGSPGIKTLWIGFQTLSNIVYGMMMGKKIQNTLS